MATYIIKSGDSLSSIANQNGISLQSLLSANPQISNANLIYPGQAITIPTTTSNGNQSGWTQNPDGTWVGPQNFPWTNEGNTPGSTNPIPNPNPDDPKIVEGGVITFHLLTADGPTEVPIFFPPNVFKALSGTSLYARWGLGFDNPQIQIGQSETFINAVNQELAGTPALNDFTSKLSSLDFFDEISAGGGADLPPIPEFMRNTGIVWAQDPITGEFELIDTMPLVGPSVDSYRYVPTDPSNPNLGGSWEVLPDLAGEDRSIFEGVPTSVQPWLQYALDNGGDWNVVPSGPARSWVKYILDQTSRSSTRAPGELPFGIGLPNFPGGQPGQTVPDAPMYPGQTGGTAVPTGAPQDPMRGQVSGPYADYQPSENFNQILDWVTNLMAENNMLDRANVWNMAANLDKFFDQKNRGISVGVGYGEDLFGYKADNTPMGILVGALQDAGLISRGTTNIPGIGTVPLNSLVPGTTPWSTSAPTAPIPNIDSEPLPPGTGTTPAGSKFRQTTDPDYYSVPAAPVQPQSGNPLQEQNGWILGSDGIWRAPNPLTGQTPNSSSSSSGSSTKKSGSTTKKTTTSSSSSPPPPPPPSSSNPTLDFLMANPKDPARDGQAAYNEWLRQVDKYI